MPREQTARYERSECLPNVSQKVELKFFLDRWSDSNKRVVYPQRPSANDEPDSTQWFSHWGSWQQQWTWFFILLETFAADLCFSAWSYAQACHRNGLSDFFFWWVRTSAAHYNRVTENIMFRQLPQHLLLSLHLKVRFYQIYGFSRDLKLYNAHFLNSWSLAGTSKSVLFGQASSSKASFLTKL